MDTWTRTLTLAAMLACSTWVSAQTDTRSVEWPRGVRISRSEKQEILALAKVMGVADPVKVSVGAVLAFGRRSLTVDGRVYVNGPQRSWARARMFRENWRAPADAQPPDLRRHRVRHWIPMGEGEQVSQWRIEDGSWFVDLLLDPDVPYADAQRIVLAIRHGTLVNRLPEVSNNGAMVRPPVQLDNRGQVSSIRRDGPESFEVSYWLGDYLEYAMKVRLSEGQVLLLSVSVSEV